MNDELGIQLFLYNNAVAHKQLEELVDVTSFDSTQIEFGSLSGDLGSYVLQFDKDIRDRAVSMAKWYMLFHMLENSIRQFIGETLEEQAGENWWDECIPEQIRKDVELNKNREQDFAINARSNDLLEYTTFGQLGDIIRENWKVFGGLLSSQKALGRVMAMLNMLRGPIAHCGALAPDETARLELSIKDWFRVLSGPGD